MEPSWQVDGTRVYTQSDVPETRDGGFASSIFRRREYMTVYHGVIQDNRVVLEGDVQLANGLPVEVRPREAIVKAREHINTVDERHSEGLDKDPIIENPTITEDDFKMRLRAEGRLAPPIPRSVPTPRNRRLIDVVGQPLSEQIIAERR